ncbi:MAG: carboxylesterase family protein, partial [Henriciella sp.]
PEQTVNAYHSAEIPFVFDLHGAAPLTPADQAITDHMTGYWLNFAKTASPNGPGLTDWPAYSPDQKTWLIFDKEIHTEENVRKRKLDALESGLQRLMTNAANER